MDTVAAALAAGAIDYIAKPFDDIVTIDRSSNELYMLSSLGLVTYT